MPVTLNNTEVVGAASIAAAGVTYGIVQNSSGHVTFPYRPAFDVHGVAGTSYVSGSNFIFPTVILNTGGHYNTSNGRFTAPVAGTYIFYWAFIGAAGATVYRYRIRKNGSNIGDVHLRLDATDTGSEYPENGARQFMTNLAVNDYIQIFFQSDNGTATYPAATSVTDPYAVFCGFLLG
jgi:hypothetical protein